MVKYCSACGAEIPDEGLFCPKCGKEAVNLNDANRKNPLSEVEKPKTGSGDFKSDKFIIALVILFIVILASFALLNNNLNGFNISNSGDNYNISYKGIYLSGKGIANHTDSSFVNETFFEGVYNDYIEYYNVTLNDGEWYGMMISEIEIENASNNPNYNVNAANMTTYEDLGVGYSVPYALKYTNYSEIRNGTNITYAYSVCIYSASHYKYLSTDFLDSIIYPQKY